MEAGVGEHSKGMRQFGLGADRFAEPKFTWYEAHGVGEKGLKIRRFLD